MNPNWSVQEISFSLSFTPGSESSMVLWSLGKLELTSELVSRRLVSDYLLLRGRKKPTRKRQKPCLSRMVQSCAQLLIISSDSFFLPDMLLTLIPIIKVLSIPSIYIIGDGGWASCLPPLLFSQCLLAFSCLFCVASVPPGKFCLCLPLR